MRFDRPDRCTPRGAASGMPGTRGDERGREPPDDLGEPWRWGLETSQLIGERLLELYRDVGASAFNGSGRGLDEDLRQVRIDMERWVDLSVEVFDRAFAIMRRLGDNGHGAAEGGEGVSLTGFPGAPCSGDMWVHNTSDDERAAPVLRCPGLAAAGGGDLPGSAVSFELDLQPLAGRTSRKVTVVVDTPTSASQGIYHGQILSDASPASAIPLRVHVQQPAAPQADA